MMSRFTQAPFKKPSPLDLPRPYHPLSPPETDVTADSTTVNQSRDTSAYMDAAYMKYSKVDAFETFAPSVPMPEPQLANGKYRRPSNLQYHSSTSIRSEHRPRSATRWLVMVIPPPVVAQEHGSGSGMLLNASARSNHGILLPLLSNVCGLGIYGKVISKCLNRSFPDVWTAYGYRSRVWFPEYLWHMHLSALGR